MLKTKWWLIVKKKEMTRMWSWWHMVPVTLLEVSDQKVLRHKTQEKDWYTALVVVADQKKSWLFAFSSEYCVEESVLAEYPVWSILNSSVVEWCSTLRFVWVSKWKWFQWWMKRHWFWWWPATHGSKFHRALWSTGNRKPRRTHKWKKMAWHMWSEIKTLKSLHILEVTSIDWVEYVVVRWSVPGSYNSYADLKIVD